MKETLSQALMSLFVIAMMSNALSGTTSTQTTTISRLSFGLVLENNVFLENRTKTF